MGSTPGVASVLTPKIANLLLATYFNKTIGKAQTAENCIPAPTFASALAY
jgi:hypothetical protein